MNKQDLARKINDLLIIKQDDSNYHLFGHYHISKTDDIYIVSTLYDSEIQLQFAQLKHAVTWCVFHKNKKHKDLPKIAELDEKLGGLQVTINNLKRLAEKAKSEDKPIYLAKLFEDKVKRQVAQKAMNYYIDTSKYWQTKTFKDSQTL
jgi:ribosomal protein L34E